MMAAMEELNTPEWLIDLSIEAADGVHVAGSRLSTATVPKALERKLIESMKHGLTTRDWSRMDAVRKQF